MTVADDFVAAQQPFVDASPDGSHEKLLRAIAAMFAQMEDYAADVDDDDVPTWFVSIPNQAPNPNFEHDPVGQNPAGFTNPAFTFKADNAWAASGAQSGHVNTGAQTAGTTVTIPIIGPSMTPTGTTGVYKAPVSRQVALRYRAKINSVSGTFLVGWQQATYDSSGALVSAAAGLGAVAATAGQTIDVIPAIETLGTNEAYVAFKLAFICTVPGTLDVNVDNIGIYFDPAGAVPPYTDPDIPGSGWVWASTPGNSMSYPAPEIPQVGWSKMLDVNRADTAGLPYLGQWLGERIPSGMADAQGRQLIRTNPNAFRGTLQAVAEGIMPLLTGTQSVFTRERAKNDGTLDANWLAIQTYASETPNPTLIQQRIRNLLAPSNIQIDYATLSRNTWATIQSGAPTWATIQSGGKTWTQIETTLGFPAGYTLWLPS